MTANIALVYLVLGMLYLALDLAIEGGYADASPTLATFLAVLLMIALWPLFVLTEAWRAVRKYSRAFVTLERLKRRLRKEKASS